MRTSTERDGTWLKPHSISSTAGARTTAPSCLLLPLHFSQGMLAVPQDFFFFLFKIKVQLICNIVLVSGVQQSDSVIYPFIILFHYRLLQDNEYSHLCYRVNPCCLSILGVIYLFYISVHPILLIYPSYSLSPFVTISLFPMSVSLFLLCK